MQNLHASDVEGVRAGKSGDPEVLGLIRELLGTERVPPGLGLILWKDAAAVLGMDPKALARIARTPAEGLVGTQLGRRLFFFPEDLLRYVQAQRDRRALAHLERRR